MDTKNLSKLAMGPVGSVRRANMELIEPIPARSVELMFEALTLASSAAVDILSAKSVRVGSTVARSSRRPSVPSLAAVAASFKALARVVVAFWNLSTLWVTVPWMSDIPRDRASRPGRTLTENDESTSIASVTKGSGSGLLARKRTWEETEELLEDDMTAVSMKCEQRAWGSVGSDTINCA